MVKVSQVPYYIHALYSKLFKNVENVVYITLPSSDIIWKCKTNGSRENNFINMLDSCKFKTGRLEK